MACTEVGLAGVCLVFFRSSQWYTGWDFMNVYYYVKRGLRPNDTNFDGLAYGNFCAVHRDPEARLTAVLLRGSGIRCCCRGIMPGGGIGGIL